MKNLIEKVKEFIKRELDNNTTNPEHSFMSGYRMALIDIRDYIKNNEKEQELIGKWGYFWDDDKHYIGFAQLLRINYDNTFGCPYEEKEFNWQNFSLEFPKQFLNDIKKL